MTAVAVSNAAAQDAPLSVAFWAIAAAIEAAMVLGGYVEFGGGGDRWSTTVAMRWEGVHTGRI